MFYNRKWVFDYRPLLFIKFIPKKYVFIPIKIGFLKTDCPEPGFLGKMQKHAFLA